MRRTRSAVSGYSTKIRARARSIASAVSATCVALGLVYATPGITCGAEMPPLVAKGKAQRLGLSTCTYDTSGKISLQGMLRVAHKPGQLPSVIQFFPSSDETEYYLGGLESQLSGRPPAPSTQRASDSQLMADAVRHMQGLPLLLGSAKLTVASASGTFSCSGFRPGNYVLLGMLAGDRDKQGMSIHSYWRADVAIPSPNRASAYNVSGFRYLGQVATPY